MSGTTVDRIRNLANGGAIRLTAHARAEMIAEGFSSADLLAGIDSAVLVEDYPDAKRGACCLLSGKAATARAMHVVCTTATADVIVITVYEPKPPKWITPTRRGARP